MIQITADQVTETLGFFWSRVFLQASFVDTLSNSLAICLQDLRNYLDEITDYTSRWETPVFKTETVRAVFLQEDLLEHNYAYYGSGNAFGDGFVYGEQASEAWRHPCETVPQYLSVTISGSEIWSLGTDYWHEDGYLIFPFNPFELDGVEKQPYRVEDGVPVLRCLLWGFVNQTDLQTISDMYGTYSDIFEASSQEVVDAVNLAWDLRVTGATAWNLRRVLYLAMGCSVPVVPPSGDVRAIELEGTRQVVYTDTSILSGPDSFPVNIDVGQAIDPDIPVFDVFRIYRGTDSIPSTGFGSATLGPGIVDGVEDGVSVLNSSQPVTYVNGQYRVTVGGSASDIDGFFATLNQSGGFFDTLIEDLGRVPTDINLFAELNRRYFGSNTLYIRLLRPLQNEALDGIFESLRAAYGAGSQIVMLVAVPDFEENLAPIWEEGVEVQYSIEEYDKLQTEITESILTAEI